MKTKEGTVTREHGRTPFSLLTVHCSLFTVQRGFTLIEIIITLVIVGIVGVSLAAFTGMLPQSTKPVQMTQTLFQLDQGMDQITADYRNRLSTMNTLFTLATLVSDINAMNSGSGVLVANGTTPTTRYVTFDSSGNESTATGTSRYLEVKLTKNGQSVTAIFSQ